MNIQDGGERIAVSVIVDGNSPWFSGHFPGDPILPGIAQLKMVVDLVSESGKGNHLCMTGLSRIKFRKTVRPGDQLDIEVRCDKNKGQYLFNITSGVEDVCSGRIFFSQIEDNMDS